MTTIRDTTAPPVEGEFRQQGNRSTGGKLLAILGVSALVLTAVNLTASISLYRAASEVRGVEKRLEELAAFEKRIIERLDLVNTGMQNRVHELNRDFDMRLGLVNEAMADFDRGLSRLRSEIGLGAASLQSDLPVETIVPLSEPAAEEEPSVIAADPPRPRRKSAPKPVSPAYQRIELPDGKVTYRKVQ
ncbi:hypothetical protein MesoLjLc_49670 [Mesorhizobium sp. L-8-10]|uniref:hypothetical protein n=1 Tax=Mesorhizobium sp. L-8-10 TaxID=2744523 RepID=UPI0019296F7D|nr:hypothetical protein [Mesorhizobium sp. L-8-10]BCH33037.1 hypothetical protein MesoLjLc_49670 [Mesorhizobium sp. L-8-10]